MLKWIILILSATLLTIIVISIIKVMLKSEKDSKKIKTEDKVGKSQEEYVPEQAPIDIHSASSGAPITEMSIDDKKIEADFVNDVIDDVPDLPMPPDSGFTDNIDNEFIDYSNFAHNNKGRRRQHIDFDLDGELADEYIPSTPDFSYIPRRAPQKKQPIRTQLNELPTELKVLMLSDIFDRKFFD